MTMADSLISSADPVGEAPTVDSVAEMLLKQREEVAEAPESVSETDTATDEVTEQDSVEQESPEVEEGVSDEATESPAEPEVAPLPPPQSWSKEDAQAWDGVPREVQEIVLRRESDRDRAVSIALQKSAEDRRALETHMQSLAAKVEELLPDIEAQFAKDWNGGRVDWVAVHEKMTADGRGDEYNALRAAFDNDKQRIEDARALRQQAEAQRNLAHQQFVATEQAKLAQLLPESADPIKGAAIRKDVAKFLQDEGLSAEALVNISAAEFRIAYDALRYRQAQKNVSSKAPSTAAPAQKTAPKAVAPQAATAPSNRSIVEARKRAEENPTIDNVAELLRLSRHKG